MVKFTIEGGKKKIIGIGLSTKDIKFFLKGKPCIIDGEELAINIDILIFHGTDELEIIGTLKKKGLISDADFNLYKKQIESIEQRHSHA